MPQFTVDPTDPAGGAPQYLTETGENEKGTEHELDPPPEVIEAEEITMDVAYRVLFCLQEDPEEVLFNGGRVVLPQNPPITHVETLVSLLVKNEDDYEIAEMHPVEVKILLTTVTTYFIHASRGR